MSRKPCHSFQVLHHREIYVWLLYSGCISFLVLFLQFGVIWKTNKWGSPCHVGKACEVLSPKCPHELEGKGGTIGGYCCCSVSDCRGEERESVLLCWSSFYKNSIESELGRCGRSKERTQVVAKQGSAVNQRVGGCEESCFMFASTVAAYEEMKFIMLR